MTMVVRVAYSATVADGFFAQRGLTAPLRRALPDPATILALALAAAATAASEATRASGHYDGLLRPAGQQPGLGGSLGAIGAHVGVGAACFLGVAIVAVLRERRALADLRGLVRGSAPVEDGKKSN